MRIFYSEHPPATELRRLVDCYWDFHIASDMQPFEHVIPPDGTVTLSAAQSPEDQTVAMICGPSTRAQLTWVQPGWCYAGIRLMPGAAEGFFGLSSEALRDSLIAVGTLPEEHRGWCERLSTALLGPERPDGLLLERARQAALDSPVAAAVEHIRGANGSTAVTELAEQHGLSDRQFRRRFRAATGLSPKEYARIVKLRHACILAVSSPQMSWSALSAEAGYADQPHLVRAVAKSFGLTPAQVGAYLRQITHSFGRQEHVRNDQDRAVTSV